MIFEGVFRYGTRYQAASHGFAILHLSRVDDILGFLKQPSLHMIFHNALLLVSTCRSLFSIPRSPIESMLNNMKADHWRQ